MRAQLQFGGQRPSHFSVQITNPVSPVADLQVPFLVKASRFPEFQLGVIEVPYFGRTIKVAGSRKFSEWNTVIINDEDWAIRNAVETWSNAINSLEGNLDTLGSSAPALYKSQGAITAYSKTGNVLRVYQFNGIWPSLVAPIETAWENGDQIMEYGVTWQYDDFVIVASQTGDAGGK